MHRCMDRTIPLDPGYTSSRNVGVHAMLRPNRLGSPQTLGLALATLLAAPMAAAQDSGVGVDLHFGNALDPTGVSGNACDPDGASWLTSERKRTPSGQLYLCPPQAPTLQQ